MKNWPWFILSFFVLVLDQLTKYWVSLVLIPYQPKPVLPLINLTLAYNTGAAFSFLSGTGGWHRWFFTVFSIVMSLALAIWLYRMPAKDKTQAAAVALILGGAVGNLLDRAVMGYVTDFIDIFYQNHHWPVFNIADTAICIGAFLLLVDLCKNPTR